MDAAGVLIDRWCTHAFLSVSVSPFDCEERMCLHEWASDMETSPCYRGGCVQEQTGSTGLFVQHTPRLPGCSPFVASVPLPSPPSHDTQTPLFPAQPSGSQITSRVL